MTHFDRFIELDKIVNKTLIVYWSEFEVKMPIDWAKVIAARMPSGE